MSETELLELVSKIINEWVDEEMSLNEDSNVTREQRYDEHTGSFLRRLEECFYPNNTEE